MKISVIFILATSIVNSTLLTPKKLCINCKHFLQDKRECAIFGDTDLITGKMDYKYASSCRNDEKKCGEEATYYEENNYKFITVPYYFYRNWWPVIYVGMIYSIILYYGYKICSI